MTLLHMTLPLSPKNVVHIEVGVVLSTVAKVSYQGPHTGENWLPGSCQLPVGCQPGVEPCELPPTPLCWSIECLDLVKVTTALVSSWVHPRVVRRHFHSNPSNLSALMVFCPPPLCGPWSLRGGSVPYVDKHSMVIYSLCLDRFCFGFRSF